MNNPFFNNDIVILTSSLIPQIRFNISFVNKKCQQWFHHNYLLSAKYELFLELS